MIRLTVFLLALAFLWGGWGVSASGPVIDRLIGGFLLYALLSTGWAVYPWAAYQFALNILAVGLVYLLLRNQGIGNRRGHETDLLLSVVLLAATIQIASVLFQQYFRNAMRPGGSFTNPNFLADYLFFGGVISIHFGAGRGRDWRSARGIFFLMLAALMGYGIYLARSRAMLPVAIGVLLFLLLSSRRTFNLYSVLAACGGMALLLAAVSTRFSVVVDPYALSRFNMWKAAWKTAVAHPFGVGLGGYKFFWFRYREPIEGVLFRYGKSADTAHSQLFGLLSELGFPGVLLGLSVAGFLLRLVWVESRREDRVLPLCLLPLGAMIHSVFDVNLDLLGISLPVAVCAAFLVNRNGSREEGTVSLSPWVRAGMALLPVLCVAYSLATYAGLARYQRGLEFLQDGKTDPAMEEFSSAARFDPFSSAYPDAISSVYFRRYLQTRKGEYLAAGVNAEQKAHAASPENPLHLSQVGFLLGELAETVPGEDLRGSLRSFALSSLQESLRKDPYNIVALLRAAEIFRRAGDTDKAREMIERLIATEPNAAKAYILLGRLAEGKENGKALAYYRKAVSLADAFGGEPLGRGQSDFLHIDRKEVVRRIEALERGHIPSHSGGE